MRSMVEGHARCFLSFIRNAAPPVPLHHLRWSPSPFQGGSAAIGRNPPSFSTQKKTPAKRPGPGGVPSGTIGNVYSADTGVRAEIGRANVCTPVTNAKLVLSILLAKKQKKAN